GATTLDEYRKHIEKDKALERRFQPVLIDEPSVDDTIAILRGIRDKFETHHGIRIQDAAIISAAKLSHRYIQNRFLPDKAIDLIDEAAARLKMEVESVPLPIDERERKITRLEIEKTALTREGEGGEATASRLREVERELAGLREEVDAMRSRWQSERDRVREIKELGEQIDNLKGEATRAERSGDYNRAAEITYSTLPALERQRQAAREAIEQAQTSGDTFLREVVTDEDIAGIVSKWTGIPVSKMLETEQQRLVNMEGNLHRRVIGQEEAITRVSSAVRLSRAGLSDPSRPIGSFLFLGPTGVGKTELAKALAEFLFDDERNVVRIDMSEYMEKFSVSRLIGSPPGYVGHEEGGQLTEAVRRRPYSVLLLDEIEKAHADVFNTLLQVLDDGRLTDSQGRVVNFKNTIVIMTSNIGAEWIQELGAEAAETKVLEALRRHFRPEFLNRVDEIVVFHALSKADLVRIVDLQLEGLAQMLAERDLTLEVTDAARLRLVEEGYDPSYGARPLKRVIQRRIQNPLALRLLEGDFGAGDRLRIDAGGPGEALRFSKADAPLPRVGAMAPEPA
ncbi:MAG: AAA family ATPase, partial [Chloroflexi bacterium]|nr:AAA family ATPase [Chloroflexota bacterium]